MSKKVSGLIVTFAIILFIVYFLFSVIPSLLFTEDYTVERVEEFTYNEATEFDGIVIRQEEVLETLNPFEVLIYNLKDGERTAVDTSIAMFSETKFSDEDMLKLYSLNRNIEVLEKTLNSVVTSDAPSLDIGFKKSLNDYLNVCSSQSMQEIITFADKLQTSSNKKNIFFKGDDIYKKLLEENKKERTEIISSYMGKEQIVYSPCAGYFFSGYDGFEYLTPEIVKTLTPEKMEDILKSEGKAHYPTYIGKVQTSPYWLFSGNLPASKAKDLQVGKVAYLEFSFEDGSHKTLLTHVYEKSYENNGKVTVTFRCGTTTQKELSLRKETCKLVHNTYSGLKVSNSSLRVVDGTDGVYAVIGQKIVFKPVEIIYSGEDFSLVAAKSDSNTRKLTINDEIVCGGKDMFDGKIVNVK